MNQIFNAINKLLNQIIKLLNLIKTLLFKIKKFFLTQSNKYAKDISIKYTVKPSIGDINENIKSACKIISDFFQDLSDPQKTQSFDTFIKNRDKFLKSISENNIIQFIGTTNLFKYSEIDGKSNIDLLMQNSEHESIISLFHIFSDPEHELRRLSNICNEIKIKKQENEDFDYSDLKNFYNHYAVEIENKENEKDAAKTKLQILGGTILFLPKNDTQKNILENFAQNDIQNIFKTIENGLGVALTYETKLTTKQSTHILKI